MNKWLEAVFGFGPTFAIGWAAKWAAIFDKTYFLPYRNPEMVTSSGVATGSVIVFIAAILFRKAPTQTLGRWSLVMLAATVVLWIVCLGIRIRLDYPSTRELAEKLAWVWQAAAFLFIVTALLAILFAIMAGISGGFDDKARAKKAETPPPR
jgi:hypothetical protein